MSKGEFFSSFFSWFKEGFISFTRFKFPSFSSSIFIEASFSVIYFILICRFSIDFSSAKSIENSLNEIVDCSFVSEILKSWIIALILNGLNWILPIVAFCVRFSSKFFIIWSFKIIGISLNPTIA